jgi:hypothetical protein
MLIPLSWPIPASHALNLWGFGKEELAKNMVFGKWDRRSWLVVNNHSNCSGLDGDNAHTDLVMEALP